MSKSEKENIVLHYIVPSDDEKEQFIIRDDKNGKIDCVVNQEFCIVENIPAKNDVEIRAIFRHCNVYISIMDKERSEVIFIYSFSIRSLANLKKSSGTYYKKHGIYVLNIQMSNFQRDEESNGQDRNTVECFIIENSKPHLMKTFVEDDDSIELLGRIKGYIVKKALQIKRVPLVESNMGSLFVYLSMLIRYQREMRVVRFIRLFEKFNPDRNIVEYIDFDSRSNLLHHAAAYSSFHLIKFIVNKCQSRIVSLNLINNFKLTPILIAQKFKRPDDIVEILTESHKNHSL